MGKTCVFRVTLLASLLALSGPAHAGDTAAAEALFREGRALMEAGDYAAACPKLLESYAQDPGTGTLLAIAFCQEQQGQTATAWATYAEVISRAKQSGRADREQTAREHVASLEPKLSRLKISVKTRATEGLAVSRDGLPIGQGAWGVAMPVDPGEHLVEARAPGKRPWRATVTLRAEADTQAIEVPALEDSPVSAKPALTAVSEEHGPADSKAEGPPLRTIGLVAGAVGLVGLGVSGFFALHAKSLNDDSTQDGHCNAANECDAAGGAKRDDAKSAATVGSVALIASGVLAAGGVTLFFLGKPRPHGPGGTARVEATPAFGAREAAVLLRGRF